MAETLERAARSLAHATRAAPNPIDSYRLISEVTRTVEHLQQTVRQLAAWHAHVVDGRDHHGEDERGDGATGTVEAAEQLSVAANVLNNAAEDLDAAHGVLRWVGE